MLYKQLKAAPDHSLLAAVPDHEHAIHILERCKITLPSTAHDVAWYPWMTFSCLLTCTRGHGLQLWDTSGSYLASYVAMNEQEDRLINMIAAAFTPSGHHIFSVGSDSLYQFDLQRTGKPISTRKVSKSMSALTIRSDDTGLMAVGSFGGEITLLNAESIIETLRLDHGISQLHLDGWNLIASARNDPRLLVWDLRNLKDPAVCFDRGPVAANQRMYWTLSGDTAFTGNRVGEVKRCTITTGSCEIVRQFEGPIAAVETLYSSLMVSVGDRETNGSLNKITID